MLEDLNEQLVGAEDALRNVQFDSFILTETFAAEDEANAQEDLNRQQAWLDQATTDAQDAWDAL